jgi:protein-S-isoprenylcysteine O-methyltransferase Ste14
MNELLDALGLRHYLLRRVTGLAIWAFFGGAMLVLAAVQALLEQAAGVSGTGTVVIVAAVWAAWSYWHSVLFGRHRQKYVACLSTPYRRAFVVDLIPGLTISFSQMLRPALNGANLRDHATLLQLPHGGAALARFGAGGLLLLVAFVLFESAWLTLGTARVGFVPEFVEPESFTPLRKGPYGHVRHPLFWSGIIFSAALALFCNTGVAVAVAVVNGIYGVVYNMLEDRRLQLVFGERYGSYARGLPHIVPIRPRAGK